MGTSSIRAVTCVALLSVTLLAGCIGGFGPSSTATATGEPFVPPEECTGDETVPGFELGSGALPERSDGFALSVNDSTVDRGDPVGFSLTNVADERRYTGTKAKYLLQRRVDDGWETVTLLREPHLGFNATAVAHAPGAGFEWTRTASAGGFTDGKYAVCEKLRPGEYRFVYAADEPIAVSFEIAD